MRAKTVLHDTTKASKTVPPQVAPPKLRSTLSVSGSGSASSGGNTVVGVAVPASKATALVTTLKVDPGG
jgi:hypothetical protein